MPYLLNSNNAFIIVDNKARQGLFYQLYSSTGFSRPFQIQSSPSDCYSATLDSHDYLHVVVQTSRKQVMHYTYLGGSGSPDFILDDSRGIYNFSNFMIYELNNRMHFFYTALKPNTRTYSLIHQTLNNGPGSVDPLITDFTPTLPLKSIFQDGTVHIFYVTAKEDGYYLNTLTYSGSAAHSTPLVRCQFPIVDFDICVINGIYHITYTQDAYGNHQLIYTNSLLSSQLSIHLSNQLGSPCISSYLGHIWISYLDNNILYAVLSVNNGQSFSLPIKSSIQDNLYQYTFFNTKPHSFIASTTYAGVSNKVRLAIISSIDVEQIHPDTPANQELDLLLDGLSYSMNDIPSAQPVSMPTYLPEPEPAAPLPSNISSPKHSSKSVLSAAQAFMNEMTLFDAQPISHPEPRQVTTFPEHNQSSSPSEW